MSSPNQPHEPVETVRFTEAIEIGDDLRGRPRLSFFGGHLKKDKQLIFRLKAGEQQSGRIVPSSWHFAEPEHEIRLKNEPQSLTLSTDQSIEINLDFFADSSTSSQNPEKRLRVATNAVDMPECNIEFIFWTGPDGRWFSCMKLLYGPEKFGTQTAMVVDHSGRQNALFQEATAFEEIERTDPEAFWPSLWNFRQPPGDVSMRVKTVTRDKKVVWLAEPKPEDQEQAGGTEHVAIIIDSEGGDPEG